MEATVSISTSKSPFSTDQRRSPAYSVYLDLIRAVAAFLVVAGHAKMLFFGFHTKNQIQISTDTGNPGPTILGLGSQAVVVFFVLSGFLVGGSAWRALASDTWSWREYLTKRLTRLWIVLIPALLVGAGLDAIGRTWVHGIYSGPTGQGMVPHHLELQSTLLVFAANALYLQGFLVPSFGTNAALWSLANEFWYYLMFPLLLIVFYKRIVWKRIACGILVLGMLAFVGEAIAKLFVVWLMGAVVARVPLSPLSSFKTVAIWFSLVQFLGFNVLTRVRPFHPLTGNLLLGISFSFLLYGLLHLRAPIKSLVFQRLAKTMASFSYSLYLYHLPMLVFLTGLLINPWHAWSIDLTHILIATLLMALTYFYAYGLFWVSERKTDELRNFLFSEVEIRRGGGHTHRKYSPKIGQSR